MTMFLRKHFLGGGPISELDDIVENLQRIFGTQRGAGHFLSNFGVSDIGFRTAEEMIVAVTDEIRENVRLYEPRVELIEVDEDWDDVGKRTKLVVRVRPRDRDDKLEIVVDLKTKRFDVRPVKKHKN